jgi:phage-related protein
MKILILIAALAIIAYLACDFAQEYRSAPGTVWDRMLAAGKGSATILWARFSVVVGAVSAVLVNGANLLNAPGVADAIKAAMQPQYVAIFTIGVALVTELARRRTL